MSENFKKKLAIANIKRECKAIVTLATLENSMVVPYKVKYTFSM